MLKYPQLFQTIKTKASNPWRNTLGGKVSFYVLLICDPTFSVCYWVLPRAISSSALRFFFLLQVFGSRRERQRAITEPCNFPPALRPPVTPTAASVPLHTHQHPPLFFFPPHSLSKLMSVWMYKKGKGEEGSSQKLKSGRYPARRKAKVPCDVLCHGASSFNSFNIPLLTLWAPEYRSIFNFLFLPG